MGIHVYYIYIFIIGTTQLLTSATFTIVGSPRTVIIGDTVRLTLTCTTSAYPFRWIRNELSVVALVNGANSDGTCIFNGPWNASYTYECYPANATYHVRFVTTITEEDQNETWRCGPVVGVASNSISFQVIVPVTTVILAPIGNNVVVDVIEGETQTFTCTTGTSRPAAWIQWYIGGRNVTNQATPQEPQQDGDKFISSSILVYTGRDTDHNKSLHCEAVNIDGRERKTSNTKLIVISIPVTAVALAPTGNNNLVDVAEGENQTFTCTTGTSRPAAWIQWYIGGKNVTNVAEPLPPQQHGDKFISSSRLVYIGNDADHNIPLYCKAVNIEGGQNITSMKVNIQVKVLVKTIVITPTGNNNVVDVVEGENQTFICTTGTSRPAAWIQWYIGTQNVTNQATPQPPQQDGDKFVSSSSLIYKGSDAHHNKTIYCGAVNGEWIYVYSTQKSIYIQVKPKNIILAPEEKHYTIRETQHIAGIFCTAICRPECTYYWCGPNSYVQNQSNLILGSVYRNKSGTYICYAINKLGNISSSGVDIEVLYPPSITNMKAHGNSTVTEGTMAMFQCDIDGNPKPDVEWKFMATGQTVHRDFAVLRSDFTINRTECSHTGIYQCQATNIINHIQEMYSQTIKFVVLCNVRMDVNQVSTPSIIGVKSGGYLNITIHLIAVPPPVISWTFYSNLTGQYSSFTSTDVFGDFAHVSILQKPSISQADLGVYTVTAYNSIGIEYKRSFTVIPQRIPNPPRSIVLFCSTISLTVLWISEFNGGDIQTFKIRWWERMKQEGTVINGITDPGYGINVYYSVNNLQPNTQYFVTVEATNTFGTATSNEIANCSTTESIVTILDSTRDSCIAFNNDNAFAFGLSINNVPGQTITNEGTGLLTAGVSTLIVGIVAVILGVVLIYMARCHRKQGKQNRSENYIDLDTRTSCIADSYATLVQPNEFDIVDHNGEKVEKKLQTYEEFLPNSDRSAEHNYGVLQKDVKTKDRLYV